MFLRRKNRCGVALHAAIIFDASFPHLVCHRVCAEHPETSSAQSGGIVLPLLASSFSISGFPDRKIKQQRNSKGVFGRADHPTGKIVPYAFGITCCQPTQHIIPTICPLPRTEHRHGEDTPYYRVGFLQTGQLLSPKVQCRPIVPNTRCEKDTLRFFNLKKRRERM